MPISTWTERKSHVWGFSEMSHVCWGRVVYSLSQILMFSCNPMIDFHISKRILFYPRTRKVNVSSHLPTSIGIVTLNLILVCERDAMFSPKPQVKFRLEGWLFLQPAALIEWILLTIVGDRFVSPCGKLHFTRSERKSPPRFHVNIYLGEVLGCSSATWFIFYSLLMLKSSSLVLEPWWLKAISLPM